MPAAIFLSKLLGGVGWNLTRWKVSLHSRSQGRALQSLNRSKCDPNLSNKSRATPETMAGQLEAFDRHLRAGDGKPGRNSSDLERNAKAMFSGLCWHSRSASGVNPPAEGTDPTDTNGTANSRSLCTPRQNSRRARGRTKAISTVTSLESPHLKSLDTFVKRVLISVDVKCRRELLADYSELAAKPEPPVLGVLKL